MSLRNKLIELRTQRKTVLDAAGAILTKAHKAKRALTSGEEQEFQRRHTDGDRLLREIERTEASLDAIRSIDHRTAGLHDICPSPASRGYRFGMVREQRSRLGRIPAESLVVDKRSDPESILFKSWLVGMDKLSIEELSIISGSGLEQRALLASTGSAGAYTVPQSFMYDLEMASLYYGGIIDCCSYIDTPDGRTMPYPTFNDTSNTGEVIGEGSTVMGGTGGAAETDPTFGVVNYNGYMFDSGMIKVTQWLFEDSAFDLSEILAEKMAERIFRNLNRLCTVGTGPSGSPPQPTGFISSAPVGATSASGVAISYGDLINLMHSVDPSYRRRPTCGWQFNDTTLAAVEKLVDSNGRPLFIAGGVAQGITTAREPDRLLNYPIYINSAMPNIADNNIAIGFGDWSKYKIRRCGQMVMRKLVERYAENLETGFISYQRFDGILLDAGTGPVKTLKCNAS
jgi:HK97 family phage major capsid protein